MSRFNTVAKGQEFVREILPAAKLANGNDAAHNPLFDLIWQGIKIKVKTRTQSGIVGSKAFMFVSFFPTPAIIYICVALPATGADRPHFWVITSKELAGKNTYYAKLEKSLIEPEKVKEAILQKSKLG